MNDTHLKSVSLRTLNLITTKSLVLSRIFFVIGIISGIIFLIANYSSQVISDYSSLYRFIALISIVCNTISFIFKYMAYKIGGIEMKYW